LFTNSFRHLYFALASFIVIPKQLGTGGFGFVCGAVRNSDGLEVAVKFILKSRVPSAGWAKDRDLGVVPMEVYILKNVRQVHPCLLRANTIHVLFWAY
jgi:serine/threonine protein kinase